MNVSVLYALVAAALFGASTPLAKLLGAQISPILLAGFLGYGVSLVMFVLALRGLGSARTGAYFPPRRFWAQLSRFCCWASRYR